MIKYSNSHKIVWSILLICTSLVMLGCEITITTPKYEIMDGVQIIEGSEPELLDDIAYIPEIEGDEDCFGKSERIDTISDKEMDDITQVIKGLVASRYCFHYGNMARNYEPLASQNIDEELIEAIHESGYFDEFVADVIENKVIIDVESLEIMEPTMLFTSIDGKETIRVYCRINQTFRAYNNNFVTENRVYNSGNTNRRDLWVYLETQNREAYTIIKWEEVAYTRLQTIVFSPEGITVSEPGADIDVINGNNIFPLDSIEDALIESSESEAMIHEATSFANGILSYDDKYEPSNDKSTLIDKYKNSEEIKTWFSILDANDIAIEAHKPVTNNISSIYKVKHKGTSYYMVEFQLILASRSNNNIVEIDTPFGTMPLGSFKVVIDVLLHEDFEQNKDIVQLRFQRFDYAVANNY